MKMFTSTFAAQTPKKKTCQKSFGRSFAAVPSIPKNVTLNFCYLLFSSDQGGKRISALVFIGHRVKIDYF